MADKFSKKPTEKPHEWLKDDPIKADWLNSQTDAIKELQGLVGSIATTGNDRYGINTTNRKISGNTIIERPHYDETNMVHYRDHAELTADLDAGDDGSDVDEYPDGYYGNVHHVLFAENQYHTGVVQTLTPEQYIGGVDGTIYTHITTDRYGNPTQSSQVFMSTGVLPNQQLWNIKTGQEGDIYIPTATTTSDKFNEDEKIAVRHRPHVLPPLTEDDSHIPPHNDDLRDVQGDKLVEPLKGNTVPARGINNHGGVKVLGIDYDNPKASVAVQASIEMYGIATDPYKGLSEPVIVHMTQDVKDSDGHITRQATERQEYLYGTYNADKPYRTSGDGILAQWPVYDHTGSKISDLKLEGGHFEDWQLWYKASGAIHLPAPGSSYEPVGTVPHAECSVDWDYRTTISLDANNDIFILNERRQEEFGQNGDVIYDRWGEWTSVGSLHIKIGTQYVEQQSTTDYKYEFSLNTDNNLVIETKTRCETFGQCAGNIYDRWSDWTSVGTQVIPIAVGSMYVQICTLTGTPSSNDYSRWIDNTLVLVQQPIWDYGSGYAPGPAIVTCHPERYISGYKLVGGSSNNGGGAPSGPIIRT